MIVNAYIPKELINLILEYDGRIQYRLKYDEKLKYRKGTYVNIIHKNDARKNIIKPIINKKIKILKHHILFDKKDNSSFYFEFAFDADNRIGLCFDYNFSFDNKFEICYYNTRTGLEQIKIYL